jgi:hypothetical protein
MKKTKKSCHCYGGFDCSTCNPRYYEEQRKNGTPWTKPEKVASTKTPNDWLADIMGQVGNSGKVDEVPEGWMTQNEIAVSQGIPMSTAFSRIMSRINAGLMQRRKFRVKCGSITTEVWHYYKAETKEAKP